MGTEQGVPQRITQDFLIELVPHTAVGRESIEAAALDVQDKLDEFANDIVDGASASANFAKGTVEIDMTVEGYSPGELYQRIGVVIDRLAKHCEIAIASGRLTDGALDVRSVASQTPAEVILA